MRLEGQIKLGYYPTPLSVVSTTQTYLKYPESLFTILDPCAGSGHALEELASFSPAVTYGVELDEKRGEQAESRLHHMAISGIESMRITHESVSLLFLNPPYDAESGTETLKEVRKEKVFLKNTYEYLKKSGVIIYIIPQERLTPDIVKILVYRFREIRVFRFADEEYKAFGQIVVFGIRKEIPTVDNEEATRLSRYWNHEEEPPILEVVKEKLYTIPPAPKIPLFRSRIIRGVELVKDVDVSTLWLRAKEMGVRREAVLSGARPPIPLHKGHMGLALVSGALDGNIGTGDNRHLVKGRVVKTVMTSVEEEVRGSGKDITKTIERDMYTVTVDLLTKNGDVIKLMSETEPKKETDEEKSA